MSGNRKLLSRLELDEISNTNTDCHLERLPDEVKCIIDKHLLPGSSKASLASTCRTFYFFYNPDHFKPAHVQTASQCRQGNFASVPTLFYHCNPAPYYNPYIRSYRVLAPFIPVLLNHVIRGEQVQAEAIVTKYPPILLETGTVKDYSERDIEGTAFQMALRAGDEIMAKAIKAIYLKANPENGQAILDTQFDEVFPNGYAAHLEEQQSSANAFERDHLNPLVEAMTNASPADLQAALNKKDNGSELCRKLNAFRVAFTALSHNEKVYNPNHLLKVSEKYNAQFDVWYGNDDNIHRWLRLDLFWRQVIGWEQRYMTTNYAQSFCTGVGNIIDNHRRLRRTLILRNFISRVDISFFPLDADPAVKLGSEFAVCNFYSRAAGAVMLGEKDAMLADFQKLCQRKTAGLGELRSPYSSYHLISASQN